MRWIAMAFGLAALGAFAEGPSDFSASATITPANGDALQRFTLPFAAYRDTRRDLSDVRVFNANGEMVPIALAGDPEPLRDAWKTTPVPMYPVSRVEAEPRPIPPPRGREHMGQPAGRERDRQEGSEQRYAEVTVRTSDGALVEVRGRGAAAKRSAVPVAYLLDASALGEPLVGLDFGWNAAPGREVVPISVEASEDLQSWRRVSHTTLYHVTQGKGDVSSARAPLVPASKAKYYRVTWSGAPDFRIVTVEGVYGGKVRSAPREVSTVAGRAGDKTGDYVFDLGARLPVEALRVVPADQNSIAWFQVYERNPPDADWHFVTIGASYRLKRDGAEIESPPREINRSAAREWMVRMDPRFATAGTAAPKLEAQWRSQQVVFVARGPAPFRLAFGDPDAKPAWVAVSSLIPDYKRGDELKLPAAAVGAVEGGPPRTVAFLPARLAELGPRKLTLWALLVGAVAILAFMAWRLHRQMRGE